MNVVMTMCSFLSACCDRECMLCQRMHVVTQLVVVLFPCVFIQIDFFYYCYLFTYICIQVLFYFLYIQIALSFISMYFCFLYRWGRKPVLIVGIFLLIVPNFIRPWMPNLLLVAMCEFLNAMGSNITYVVPFTIGNLYKVDLIIQ